MYIKKNKKEREKLPTQISMSIRTCDHVLITAKNQQKNDAMAVVTF